MFNNNCIRISLIKSFPHHLISLYIPTAHKVTRGALLGEEVLWLLR